MAKIGNINVKVLRKHENSIIGVRVELVRKMTIAGKIIYVVVITNMGTGHHYVIRTFDGIIGAWNLYKAALA